MSCSLWRWTPSCDHDACPGDCDLCSKEDEEWLEAEKEFQESMKRERENEDETS